MSDSTADMQLRNSHDVTAPEVGNGRFAISVSSSTIRADSSAI
jgi:hypothetical protein